MAKLRISLTGLVAVCLASMFTAAAASAAGPFWHANGTKLIQGSIGVKLQSKGALSLKSTLSGLSITITCGRSTGDGTIDGQGATRQGQGKSLIKFEQCRITNGTKGGGECRKPATITTNQLKRQGSLGIFPFNTSLRLVWEPAPSQQTSSFVTILFGECSGSLAILTGITVPVTGSVAGEVQPQELESQEGAFFFPSEPIKVVETEGQEHKVGLFLRGVEATFTGYYGVRVQRGTFGIFKE